MSSSTSTPGALDSHVADAIARAERRRACLERITEVGMRLIDEIEARTIGAPYHPEPRHDPNRSFAAVSRSVRLTLAFEARIDRRILAMRKTGRLPGETAREAACSASADPFAPVPNPLADATRARRERVRDAVWAAIEREAEDPDEVGAVREHLHERLIEGERYDALLCLPFRECVAAICADLGLIPDWSGWSDDAGFPPPPPAPLPSLSGGPPSDGREPGADDPRPAEAERRWRAEPVDA